MKSVLALLVFANLFCTGIVNAAVVSIKEAIIPAGFKNINLVCVVSGLYKSELEEEKKLINQINFKVGEEDKPIARSQGETNSNFNLDLYWKLNDSNPELLAESSDKFRVIYNVTIGINNRDEDTIKNLAQSGKIPIKAFFQYKDKNGAAVEGTGSAGLFLEHATEAPKGLKVNPIHKGLNIQWEKATSIKHTDDKSYRVSNMLVMLFKEGESEIDLKAKQANNNDGNDPDFFGCRYVAGQEDCIQCEDNAGNIYISSDQGEQQDKTLNFKLVSNDKGGTSFNNLEPDANYVIALQYQDGTKRTMCKEGKTILSLSLTESNGEEDGTLTDTRCFIATAAFGSPFHQHVEVFRWFRSSILLKTNIGKKMVSYYYEHSPTLANFIAKSEKLRSLARGVLTIPAFFLHGLRLFIQNQTVAFGAFVAFLSILSGMYQAKRLSRWKP